MFYEKIKIFFILSFIFSLTLFAGEYNSCPLPSRNIQNLNNIKYNSCLDFTHPNLNSEFSYGSIEIRRCGGSTNKKAVSKYKLKISDDIIEKFNIIKNKFDKELSEIDKYENIKQLLFSDIFAKKKAGLRAIRRLSLNLELEEISKKPKLFELAENLQLY